MKKKSINVIKKGKPQQCSECREEEFFAREEFELTEK